MTQLENYFSSYSNYHQTAGNKITHYFGIPLILFSTLGLLSMIEVYNQFDLGFFLWLGATLFYFKLNWKMALPFSVVTLLLYGLSLYVMAPIHWVLFVSGWILQGIGHYVYEKKSPAFLTNISHLLIGPFWIFCHFWMKFTKTS